MKTLLAILLLSVSGLAQTTITLKTQAARGKYGLVTVYNTDGTFNRQFKITALELVAVNAGGRPPGTTRAEWIGSFNQIARIQLGGKDFDVGDVEARSGYLKLKFSEAVQGTRIVEGFYIFKPGEWSGTAPQITVTPVELAKIPGQPILSITNGVMILQ